VRKSRRCAKPPSRYVQAADNVQWDNEVVRLRKKIRKYVLEMKINFNFAP
jgi:hypothetical protein